MADPCCTSAVHDSAAGWWCPEHGDQMQIALNAAAGQPTAFTHFPPQSGMDDRSAEDNGLVG